MLSRNSRGDWLAVHLKVCVCNANLYILKNMGFVLIRSKADLISITQPWNTGKFSNEKHNSKEPLFPFVNLPHCSQGKTTASFLHHYIWCLNIKYCGLLTKCAMCSGHSKHPGMRMDRIKLCWGISICQVTIPPFNVTKMYIILTARTNKSWPQHTIMIRLLCENWTQC